MYLISNDLLFFICFSIFGVRYFDGYWLYPFMKYLSVTSFTIMFFVSVVLLWLIYIVGDTMNVMLWGKPIYHLVFNGINLIELSYDIFFLDNLKDGMKLILKISLKNLLFYYQDLTNYNARKD